jgi:signal transduction histidine kinase
LVSRGTAELIVNLSVFACSLVFSFILISSVKKEIQRREEVTKLAASLEKLNAQLKEADRQKTEFLSIASHQLRTPLSILKGYVELIEDEAYGKINKELRRVLNNINEGNERLITLVDEFLNVSRIEQGRVQYNFESCELRDIVKSTIDEFADRAKKKGISMVFDGDRHKLSTFCDKEKVRLVFFNYIDNAIKYGNNTPLKISIKEKDEGVAVSVSDKGIGFSIADSQHLFSRYYRSSNTDRVGEVGYGLGLYVCRKFIEAQGGKVWAKSTGINRGSEFGFWLPYKKGK